MTLPQQIQLMDELIAENPDLTVREYWAIIKNPEKAKKRLIRKAQIKLKRIWEERYKDLKTEYAHL